MVNAPQMVFAPFVVPHRFRWECYTGAQVQSKVALVKALASVRPGLCLDVVGGLSHASANWLFCALCPRYPNFNVFSLKEHGKSGTHCVSLALWKIGGRVTSVIRTLPTEVQDWIMGLFRTVYRLVQSYQPMTNLEGNAELVALNGGRILPSYRSRFRC